MNTAIEQYALETSWSTRITDEIVLEAIQGDIPFSMEINMLEAITDLNRGPVSNKELFINMIRHDPYLSLFDGSDTHSSIQEFCNSTYK